MLVWLRKASLGAGRLAVALALAVFALAPAFDALTCAGEGEPEAAAASVLLSQHASVAAASSVDRHGHSEAPLGDAPCAHGHCHHNIAFGSEPIPEPAAPVKIARLATPPETAEPSSFDPSGLERPPRA